MVAHRDAELLGASLHVLDQFLTPLLRQLRDWDPDHLPVSTRGQTEVRFQNRLLHIADGPAIVRLNDQETRLRSRQTGYLIERRRRPVVIDHDSFEQRRGSPPGAKLRK